MKSLIVLVLCLLDNKLILPHKVAMDNPLEILNCLQWNARSARANKRELEVCLNENNITCAFISETWFKPDTYYPFSGYNIFRQDRIDGHGGVSIFLRNNIEYSNVNCHEVHNVQFVSIEIKMKNKSITLVSLYSVPTNRLSIAQWSDIFERVPQPCIISGDFNAHHTNWGNPRNTKKGVELLSAYEDANLILLNDGSATLFNAGVVSAIDLTLSSSDLAPLIDWSIGADSMGSNHYPIFFILNMSSNNCYVQDNICNEEKLNYKKANWERYKLSVQSKFESFLMSDNVEDTYNNFKNMILDSIRESVPKYKLRSGRKRTPWINEECIQSIRERREAGKAFKQNPNTENFLKAKQQAAKTKKILNSTKRKQWISYCNNLNRNTPIKDIWNNIKIFRNRQVANITVSNSYEWAEPFLDKIAPPFVSQVSNLEDTDYNNDQFLGTPITLRELESVTIDKINSAPGSDTINYKLIHLLPSNARVVLLAIFNLIMETKYIPSDWKTFIVIPLLKPGKDPKSPDSYRPISLASCMLKTFEKIIKNRLEWWLENQNILPASQSGFRKGRNTLDNLVSLTTDINKAFMDKKILAAIFVDIVGAYDNIKIPLLEKKLLAIQIPVKIIKLIINIISDRILILKHKGRLLGKRRANTGLPQGGILSPLLYILYTMDLDEVFSFDTKIIQFADDICIYSVNSNLNEVAEKLEQNMSKLDTWTAKNGFAISETKSAIVYFTRKRVLIPEYMNMGDHRLRILPQIKFLGIILDTVAKAEKNINVIRAVTKIWWGADQNTALLMYRALVRSVLDYGCILYGQANKCHLNKIFKLQVKAVKICLGVMRSTPNDAALVEAGELPFNIRIDILCSNYIIDRYATNSIHVYKFNQLEICINNGQTKKPPPIVTNYMEYKLLLDTSV